MKAGREFVQEGRTFARRLSPPLKPEERAILSHGARQLLGSDAAEDKDARFFLFGMSDIGREVNLG